MLDVLDGNFAAVDLLILDMNMPEMNGLDVVKAIRFMDTSRSLPILMLTADATPEARAACIDAGADAFFTKPINARALLDRIASISRNVIKPEIAAQPVHTDISTRQTDSGISAWYDDAVLKELADLGDFHFLENLLHNFERDGTRQVKRIHAAVDSDYLEYREALHALKGSSIELGAKKLSGICARAEGLKPYDIGTDGIKKMAAEVESAFLETTAALGNVRQQDIARH